MKGRSRVLALSGMLALAGPAWAQDASSGSDSSGTNTCEREDIKTWTMTVDGQEWGVRPATPAYEGDTGLFHMSTAYTLPRGKVSFSLFRDNLDRDPKDVDISIHGFSLGYGATDRLELFGNVGLQHRVHALALFQPGFVNDYPFVSTQWETGFGDIKLGAKYKFLDDYRGDAVGLALRGLVKLPTADEAKGLGTGKASFVGDLVLSKGLNRVADLHGSIGYELNGSPDSVDIGNAFRWGLGLNIPACFNVQLQAELTGKSYSGADFSQTSPIDLVVGPVVWIKPGIFIRPAISWNLNFDKRGANISTSGYTGRHIAVGFHPGTPCCEVYVPPPPPPPPVNRPPTVTCEADRSSVLPGETVRCRAVGSDPDGDSLTYTWSASAGRVSGEGTEVTFDSAGVPEGTKVAVTVTADDGRGGTAQAVCNIDVKGPEKPPAEPITCISGGFPRNLARLTNVDKACLDDVAGRLRQDPRSRVVIVGHADSAERYPEVIARRRAEEVKNYLVSQQGIEDARITTRSAGATKPIDTGTSATARAKNRRVELIFLPEGAVLPEQDD